MNQPPLSMASSSKMNYKLVEGTMLNMRTGGGTEDDEEGARGSDMLSSIKKNKKLMGSGLSSPDDSSIMKGLKTMMNPRVIETP